MITLCTLFNTNYLDKGLTMYESIECYTQDFVLYVLCMDDRCYEIIMDLNLPRFIPIRLSDIETPRLLVVKEERTIGEYCWTCGSCFTDYVMHTFNPEYCAYIDSDLYFYDDVNVVVKEMQERNASVMITGHRFYEDEAKDREWKVGKYCVEFNTFKNDTEGRFLLDKWKNQCLEYCKCDGDGKHWADQKYMDNWVSDYEFAVETSHLGAGVAPWNIADYRLICNADLDKFGIACKNIISTLFFYHFQGIQYLDHNTVRLDIYGRKGVQSDLVEKLYKPYLRHIGRNKHLLSVHYGIDIVLRNHPGVKHRYFKEFVQPLINSIKDFLFPKGIGNRIAVKEADRLNRMTIL